MTERLLQYIWQFQHFSQVEQTTIAEEPLFILFPGTHNINQGPDFINAKIRIGNTIWVGHIELHIKTSDWEKHKHQLDDNYKNVILHVVWENDIQTNGIPVFELKDKVSKILLKKYEDLMNASSFIPCEKSIQAISDITWKSWKERLLAERLLRKTKIAETFLQQNNQHWEETFWWLLAKSFGSKINAGAFEAIARSIPVNILAKHKNQIHQLEALLLGQAGLLNDKFTEGYPKMLQKEYKFLKDKYALKPINQPIYFLRMRPGNFPSIRLAQLAMLIHDSAHLFSKIKETVPVKEIKQLLDITANDYWHYHYRFDETSPFKKKKLGMTMINNVVINTIVPVLFAYGDYKDEIKYKEQALKWLEDISSEKNSITKGFETLGIENKNAYDSQSLIELKNEYCNKKRCLECGVGNAILRT